MGQSAEATFKIESWDEEPYSETGDRARLTRATVEQSFSGDIEGTGSVQWLMCYRPDGTADFVGLQRFSGRLAGIEGSFVMAQTEGTFDGNEARGRLSIVPESATDELRGITGDGEFVAPRGGTASLSLRYERPS